MLYDLIVDIAENSLKTQRKDGSMPPGINGPWKEQETPVRNTLHWTITFLRMYEITKDKRFKSAAERAISYLLTKEARPNNATFHDRYSKKDRCNGLVGQAWTIEAFMIADEILNRKDLMKISEELFLLHPFDESLGLWKRVDIDGTVLDFDITFNHQLWFAMIGYLLADRTKNSEIERQVNVFIEKLPKNLGTYKSGLIKHPINTSTKWLFTRRILNKKLVKVILGKFIANSTKLMKSKAVGYHSFNMYAFALMYEKNKNLDFWKSRKFMKMLEYIKSDEYKSGLDKSVYGYPYNISGFEIPLVIEVFNMDEPPEWWINKQIEKCYDSNTKRMDKNNPDPETLTARIYEATRLPNYNTN